MFSIGKQLMQARLDAGETIEDAAFATRIPRQRLREMENDDFSGFPNLTYAKSFLRLYSRHLGLDISDYLEQFDTAAVAAANGQEYARRAYALTNGLSGLPPAPSEPPLRFRDGGFDLLAAATQSSPRAGVNAALAGAGLLALVICFFKFSGDRDEPSTPPVSQPVAETPAPAKSSSQRYSSSRELALMNDRPGASAPSRPAATPMVESAAVKTTPASGTVPSSLDQEDRPAARVIGTGESPSGNRSSQTRSSGGSEERRGRGA